MDFPAYFMRTVCRSRETPSKKALGGISTKWGLEVQSRSKIVDAAVDLATDEPDQRVEEVALLIAPLIVWASRKLTNLRLSSHHKAS
jgi:hypothetical protein